MARIPAVKGKNWVWWGLTGAAAAAGLILTLAPGINAAVMHGIDRFKNRLQAGKELKELARRYRFQVAQQLGVDPDKVGKKDLLTAAQMNPQLGRIVQEVHRREGDDNRFSMLASAGGAIPFVGPTGKLIADASKGVKVAAAVGGGIGGSAMAALMGKERVDPNDVVEAIQGQLAAAQEQGTDPRRAINGQLIFMLRVSQDEAFAAQIKKEFGKSFQKMSEAEQTVVMNHYPALANASMSEAHAVATGILPVEELMARPPNLNSMASAYAGAPPGDSFRQREAARRAMAQQAAGIPSV